MKKEKEMSCLNLPTGDRLCLDHIDVERHFNLRHFIIVGLLILSLALLTGLGMDIIALIVFVGGIALTGVGIVVVVLTFSYRVWIGIVFVIGVGIGIYFLWIYGVIPAWFTLGDSLVTALENLVAIFTP